MLAKMDSLHVESNEENINFLVLVLDMVDFYFCQCWPNALDARWSYESIIALRMTFNHIYNLMAN